MQSESTFRCDVISEVLVCYFPRDIEIFRTIDMFQNLHYGLIDDLKDRLTLIRYNYHYCDMKLLEYLGSQLLRRIKVVDGMYLATDYNLRVRLKHLDLFVDHERLDDPIVLNHVMRTIYNNPWFFLIIYLDDRL